MTEIITLPRQRGRPAFKPTFNQRQRVERLKFCGESDNMIARSLAIDPDTLRKHFVDELADGYAQRRAELVDHLFTLAGAGKVSAITALLRMSRCDSEEGEA